MTDTEMEAIMDDIVEGLFAFCVTLGMIAQNSESQIFVQKFNFDKKPNIFTSFSPKIFLTIFLVKSMLLIVKKSKTTTFSRVFLPKKIDNFLGKSKLNFRTKN